MSELVPKPINPRRIIKRLRKALLMKKQAEKEGVAIPVALPYPYPLKEPEKEKEKPKKEVEGIDISPEGRFFKYRVKAKKEEDEIASINVKYPLIPKRPKRGEYIYAYAHIKYDEKTKGLIYYLMEPPLTRGDMNIIDDIKRDLEERLDIDITKLGAVETKEILINEIDISLKNLGVEIDETKKRIIVYYIERDALGLGKIEALMRDPNIEDISCDGVGIYIYVYYRDPRIGSIRTNIKFDTQEELDSFIIKLAQKCNKTISIAEPLLDGTLPDGSRVQATLGSDIARRGSNFTIRRFTKNPLTPTHMLRFKTLNSLQLAYLWLAVEHGQSILISGGTATGKTSLLNVLSLFIRPNLKVVSIEDTSEIQLPLEHWIPHVARSPLSIKGKTGEVTLFDLLKASLRQRPDYIIVGEVRGREAFVLFQQMATGHPSLATIHAATIPQLIDRLITPPISLPPRLLENINIIVFLSLSRIKEETVRRANTILEVIGVENERPVTRTIFEWNPTNDSFEKREPSVVLKKIARMSGLSEDEIIEELFRRKRILEWMLKNNMYDYREVAKLIHAYYNDPAKVMDIVAGTVLT
jgi:flagellar protein FlaI